MNLKVTLTKALMWQYVVPSSAHALNWSDFEILFLSGFEQGKEDIFSCHMEFALWPELNHFLNLDTLHVDGSMMNDIIVETNSDLFATDVKCLLDLNKLLKYEDLEKFTFKDRVPSREQLELHC